MEIRGRGEAGAAESAVAPAGGRRPCAPQPWRLRLSRRPSPPPPLLPDKGRFNQVGREGGEGASVGGEREGTGPLPRRPRAAPAYPLQIRPAAPLPAPQPQAQVHKSARFLRPPWPFPGRRRRRLLCEAARPGP